MKTIVKSTLVLVAITLVAGLSLAAVNHVTEEPIEIARDKAQQNAYRVVMPEATQFINMSDLTDSDESKPLYDQNGICITDCMLAIYDLPAEDSDTSNSVAEDTLAESGTPLPGLVIGYVYHVETSNGYGDKIKLAVGLSLDGTLTGISIISHSETPGLGAKCKDKDFTEQFAGIKGFVKYVKGEKTESNQIQAITSATITTEAVTDAVNAAITCFESMKGGSQRHEKA